MAPGFSTEHFRAAAPNKMVCITKRALPKTVQRRSPFASDIEFQTGPQKKARLRHVALIGESPWYRQIGGFTVSCNPTLTHRIDVMQRIQAVRAVHRILVLARARAEPETYVAHVGNRGVLAQHRRLRRTQVEWTRER